MTPIEKLEELEACEGATEWAQGKDWPEIIETCHRGDWLLWLAKRVDVDRKLVVLAAVRSARLAEQWMRQASKDALDVVERWCRGNATEKEFRGAVRASVYASACTTNADYVARVAATIAANSATNADDADYVCDETIKKSANICREVFGKELLEALTK